MFWLTRPKPPYGRKCLAGRIVGQGYSQVGTFWRVLNNEKNVTSQTQGPNWPSLVIKRLRQRRGAPTNLLWCKKRYVSDAGPQLHYEVSFYKWLWIGWRKLKWKLKWNVQYPFNVLSKIVQEATMQWSKKRCKGAKAQHDQRSERVVANWRNIGARTCFTGTRGGWDAVNVIKGTAIIVLRLMIISF